MKLIWALLFPLLLVGILSLIETSLQPPAVGISLQGKLPPAQAKAVDTLTTITNFFMTLAIGIFGGIAYFLKQVIEGKNAISFSVRVFLGCSAVLALLSIFFGHLIFINLVELLRNDLLGLDSAFIVWPVRLQYIFLLTAVAELFLAFFVAAVDPVKSHDQDLAM